MLQRVATHRLAQLQQLRSSSAALPLLPPTHPLHSRINTSTALRCSRCCRSQLHTRSVHHWNQDAAALNQQMHSSTSASSLLPATAAAVSSPSPPSLPTYINQIILCMKEDRITDACSLFIEMHTKLREASRQDPTRIPFEYEIEKDQRRERKEEGQEEDGEESSREVASASFASTALSSPSSSSPLLLALMRFHFSPLSIRQYRQTLSRIQQSLSSSKSRSAKSGTAIDYMHIIDMQHVGRTYLIHAAIETLCDEQAKLATEKEAALDLSSTFASSSSLPHRYLTINHLNHLLRSCAATRPQSQRRQAEAINRWMSLPHNSTKFIKTDLTYMYMIQTYTNQHHANWRLVYHSLKREMDEIGIVMTERLIVAMITAAVRACDIEPELNLKPHYGTKDASSSSSLDTNDSIRDLWRDCDRLGGVRTIPPPPLVRNPEKREAFLAVQSFLRQVHPTLITPNIQAHFMRAAIVANEYRFALDLFQTQYNLDQQRMQDYVDRWKTDRKSVEYAQPEHIYFRMNITRNMIHGLMFCASELADPVRTHDLWLLLNTPSSSSSSSNTLRQEPSSKQAFMPGAFDVPMLRPPPLQSTEVVDSPPEIYWVQNPLRPNHATRWHLVSWIDALIRHKFTKQIKQITQKQHGRETASISAPSSSPPSSVDPLPTLRSFHSRPSHFGEMSNEKLDTFITSLREIEKIAHDKLARPDLPKFSQSIWQPYTEGAGAIHSSSSSSKFQPELPSFRTHSHLPPSPFHLNLHYLPREGLLSNLESVLHLSLRKIQSLFLSHGQGFQETGWCVVHGFGKDRSKGYESESSKDVWRAQRYKAESSSEGEIVNPVSRVFYAFVGSRLKLQPNQFMRTNPGMSRILHEELERVILRLSTPTGSNKKRKDAKRR